MNRYTLIEKELMHINEGKFQLICNAFLEHEYSGDIQCPGTVAGKEKTRKGMPDAYIIQEDGTYILAEYTTMDKSGNKKAFIKKLEKDLRRCLDFDKLSIKPEQISEIVLCHNSKVEINEIELLKQIAQPSNIPLRFVGIDRLALYLFTKGRYFAHQHLGIPFDTGQILNKKEFLRQYGKRNISTPLDNQLVGRQNERSLLVDALYNSDIVIVKGPAGVGKSRLSLQVIDDFLSKNPSYSAFYLWNKTGSISEELTTLFESKRSYIFFVDDANRQLNNLLSIIHTYVERENIQIKIIITVRDYAKEDVIKRCKEYRPAIFSLNELHKRNVYDIITSADFNIQNVSHIERIVKISKGNPRLAIMAARLLQNKPDLSQLNDVSTIYDEYFQGIIDDKQIFNDITILKALSLVSFFYSFDLESDSVKSILYHFNIPYESFIETIVTLEELELVEVYLKYVARVSEQILATYFFYKTFIKDGILSFDVLLEQYFEGHYRRMKDLIDPLYSSFGEQKTIYVIKNSLIRYFYKIEGNFDLTVKFLRIFGKFLPDQTFSFTANYLNHLRSVTGTDGSPKTVGSSDHFLGSHPILQVLRMLYKNDKLGEVFAAIELSVNYIEINPDISNLLLGLFQGNFVIKNEDVINNCSRQCALYNYLYNRLNDGYIFQCFFYFSFEYIILRQLKKKYFYVKENGCWQPSAPIKDLRGRFWDDINLNFERHSGRNLLKRYIKSLPGTSNSLLRFDEEYICCIINTHLSPLSFEDCYIVQEYIGIIEAYYPLTNRLKEFKTRFVNEAYRVFNVLRLRKDQVGFNEPKIEKELPINNIEDFKAIYIYLLESYPFLNKDEDVQRSLDLLLSRIIERRPQLGFDILCFYITEGNKFNLYPSAVYKTIFNLSGNWHKRLLNLINENSFCRSDYWKSEYFSELKKSHASKALMYKMMDFYATARNVSIIYSDRFDKFIPFEKNIHEKILSTTEVNGPPVTEDTGPVKTEHAGPTANDS